MKNEKTNINQPITNPADLLFEARWQQHLPVIRELFDELYSRDTRHEKAFEKLCTVVKAAWQYRPETLKQKDHEKEPYWFLSNDLAGMSLYVDRFCSDLETLNNKLPYFEKLGINFLHLMPIFESPENESDGGYAVSDFRKINNRFGTIDDLQSVIHSMMKKKMFLMLDIVLNHTSDQHEWAQRAKKGEKEYQDLYYLYDTREIPDRFERTLPEVFPEAAPGNFTHVPECNKWAMTVFHQYQWDLNYSNPLLFVRMLDTIFFYANLGVDILRIDAPAFIWKQMGTSCQNLPQAHTLLRLFKQCVLVAAPGMALLGEAIVAPREIMKYFGTDLFIAKECDVAYNATHMALQWDALATGDTRIMMSAQPDILRKPFGTTWINYTRCHDDIGLAYDDWMIEQAGFNPWMHRKFLKDYYSGQEEGSPATGALFAFNLKTGDARISGSLASLCGLEKALEDKEEELIRSAINRILLMQAHSIFLGGIPMLFYGDEFGALNDTSYLADQGKNYDNRWMHRPVIHWDRMQRIDESGTIENRIFTSMRQLIALRRQLSLVSDREKIAWMYTQNNHIAAYMHAEGGQKLFCLFNFSDQPARVSWYIFKEKGCHYLQELQDQLTKNTVVVGRDDEFFELGGYGFTLMM